MREKRQQNPENRREERMVLILESFIAPDARVLVVDDTEMNIWVVEGMLERYRVQMAAATSGKQALEMIEGQDFDFVFMDQMMPEMDGIETLRQIRSKPGTYYEKLPVVALTANTSEGAREMLLAEGFTDFVEKPIENSVLARVLLSNLPEEKIVRIEESEEPEGADTEVYVEQGPDKKEQDGAAAGRAEKKEPAAKEEFAVGDLDVKTALLYCGGLDNYKRILNNYAEKGKDNWEPIEKLFQQENWEDYTIAVHAVKSTMLSIGAKPLSEMAKALEMAGKEKNLDYIRENHEEMVVEYKRVIGQITEAVGLPEAADGEENLPQASREQLSREAFDSFVDELEEAMYDLDGEKMKAILEPMKAYDFGKVNLADVLRTMEKKIDHADYMSAVESLRKLCEQ